MFEGMGRIDPIRAAFEAYTDWSGLYLKGGDYGVTQLLMPPRIVQLQERYKDLLPPETVEDRLKAFQGNAWHSFLERNLRKAGNTSKEWKDRFLVEAKIWDKIEGIRIAGKIDLYDTLTDILYDWKVCGVYKAKVGDYEDWEEQLNIYAHFMRTYNYIAKGLRIVAIHPDWDKWGPTKDPLYPEAPIHSIELKLWLPKTSEDLVIKRVKRLIETKELTDCELPLCSKMDMWEKETSYALMEPGKDRATRVLPTMDEMEGYIEYREQINKPLKRGYTIVTRGGERTRCESYCRVNQFCNQYHEYCMEKKDA